MKPTLHTSTIAGQWQQAIRGNTKARAELLRCIMPARHYRPASK